MSTQFQCHGCGNISELFGVLSAFSQNPACPRCGMSAAEVDNKMSDDLADLMSRNMYVSYAPVSAPTSTASEFSSPPTPQTQPQGLVQPITYISQHYHHSTHQAPVATSENLQASTVLRNVGVNPDVLLPSQLALFKNADPEQQQRLVELWKIVPPAYGNQLPNMSGFPQTSMEAEEQAARLRWEKLEAEKLRNLCALPSQQDSTMNAEPYMQSGMDVQGEGSNISGYKQSTDPVYQRDSKEWWHMSEVDEDEPMEHQYGIFQHMQMMGGFCGIRTRATDDHMMS